MCLLEVKSLRPACMNRPSSVPGPLIANEHRARAPPLWRGSRGQRLSAVVQSTGLCSIDLATCADASHRVRGAALAGWLRVCQSLTREQPRASWWIHHLSRPSGTTSRRRARYTQQVPTRSVPSLLACTDPKYLRRYIGWPARVSPLYHRHTDTSLPVASHPDRASTGAFRSLSLNPSSPPNPHPSILNSSPSLVSSH